MLHLIKLSYAIRDTHTFTKVINKLYQMRISPSFVNMTPAAKNDLNHSKLKSNKRACFFTTRNKRDGWST